MKTLTVEVEDVICAGCETAAVPQVASDMAGARFELPEGWRRGWMLGTPEAPEFEFAVCGGCVVAISTVSLPIKVKFLSWSDGGRIDAADAGA